MQLCWVVMLFVVDVVCLLLTALSFEFSVSSLSLFWFALFDCLGFVELLVVVCVGVSFLLFVIRGFFVCYLCFVRLWCLWLVCYCLFRAVCDCARCDFGLLQWFDFGAWCCILWWFILFCCVLVVCFINYILLLACCLLLRCCLGNVLFDCVIWVFCFDFESGCCVISVLVYFAMVYGCW